jgi:signal transduction histidine kinase/ligand-binding sensor domain-containing protein
MRYTRHRFIGCHLAVWLCGACSAFAFHNPQSESPFVVRTWSLAEGAPTNRINDLIEGSDGFLWLATYEGLIRYDGYRHAIYNHQDSPALVGGVLTVVEGVPGTLWMGTTAGELVRLRAGEFSRWGAAKGLPADQLDRLVRHPDGRIVLRSADGLVTIGDDDAIVPFPTPGLEALTPAVYAFAEDGALWVAPRDGGLIHWQDGVTRRIPLLQLGAASNQVNALRTMRDGSLWLGIGDGAALLSVDQKQLTSFPLSEFRQSDRTLRFSRHNHGPVIGGSRLRDLYAFSAAGIYPLNFGELGDENETVNGITALKEGGYAIATYSQGLVIITRSNFPFYNRQNGLDGILVNAIHPWGKDRWLIANHLGVVIFDGHTFSPLLVDGQPFAYYTVDVMVDSRDRVWLATIGNGLFMLDGQLRLHLDRSSGLLTDTIRCLAEDSQGNIWFGTREGLYRWNQGVVAWFGREHGLRSEYVLSLYIDPLDQVWVGMARGGVQKVVDGQVVDPPSLTPGDFSSRTIFAMQRDGDGVIWGGMSGGIFRIANNRIEFLNLYQQMNVDAVFHVVDDRLGNLWLSSNQGLQRIAHATLRDSFGRSLRLDDQVRLFSRKDGLPANAIRALSRMHRDTNHRLWFPTENGFVIMDPANMPDNTVVPSVFIDQVEVDDQNLAGNWSFAHKTGLIAPDPRRIRFRYVAPQFNAPDGLRFKVRLRGYETAWQTTRSRFTDYTNLHPGDYVFEVMVANSDGEWNPKSATFSFTIAPHFYQSAWFYGLALASVGGLAVGGLGARSRTLRKQRLKLEQLVAERTQQMAESQAALAASNAQLQQLNAEKNELMGIAAHDLKNPISAIEGLATILHDDLAHNPNTSLQPLAADIISTAQRMAGIIYNLLDINRIEAGEAVCAPITVPAKETFIAICADYGPQAGAKQIHLLRSCDLADDITVSIDPAILKQVVDNLVSNALKFSPPGCRVWLKLTARDTHTIRFSVADEGPGISASDKQKLFTKFARLSARPTGGELSTGLGLSIARHLVTMMGGSIGCDSSLGEGATFWIEFPIVDQATGS